MPTPPDETLPPILREHEQLIRDLLPLLQRMAALTDVPELIDQTATALLVTLKSWSVPSWQAAPVIAQALIDMCEPNLAASEALRARGLTNPADPDPTPN